MRRLIFVSMATVLFAAPLCVSLGEAAAQALPRYQITDLGTLGGDSTRGAAINSSGQVAGSSETSAGQTRAFLWDGAYMQDLGTPGELASGATAINDHGQVTGAFRRVPDWPWCEEWPGSCPQFEIAFLWNGEEIIEYVPNWFAKGVAINANGQVLVEHGFDEWPWNTSVWDESRSVSLKPIDGMAQGLAINDSGVVTGRFGLQWYERAFVWDSSADQMHDLGTLGGQGSTGYDINAEGHVVGYASTDRSPADWWGESRAFVWYGASLYEMGTLGGNYSVAYKINNAGQVAGVSNTLDGTRHAFLWDESGMRDLGTLGGTESFPLALNDSGLVTGFSATSDNLQVRAFVWDGSAMHDLNQLITQTISEMPLLWQGEDLNDVGQILASGYNSAGQDRAYVLTPISLLFSRLLDDATGVGPGKALERGVANAISYYDAVDLGATCSTLEGFVSQVGTFAGQRNAKVTAAEAEKLLGDAYAIHAALGCP